MNPVTLCDADDPALDYLVTHVFFPVELPKASDYTPQNDFALARAVCAAAHAYTTVVDNSLKPQWIAITRMLDNLQASIQSGHIDKDNVVSQLGSMRSGDILAFLVRPQRAAVMLRKREKYTVYEPFEVSARDDAVQKTGGRLVYSYPGLAIEIPDQTFEDVHFQVEFANFLSLPSKIDSDPPNVPAGHPEYITALLTGILRGVGHIVEVPHVSKHVRDEVRVPEGPSDNWRRSALWLLIRVSIQTSLDPTSSGRAFYKAFMLFFISNLTRDAHAAGVSSDLLHLMSAKILQRLSKLGSSTPTWLSDVALNTCTLVQDTLDVRGMELRAPKSPSPYWNPSELDLAADTRLSLPNLDCFICDTLENFSHGPTVIPFQHKDYPRGTLRDFLSSDTSFFDKGYITDPYVTLYDVEQSVEREIDQWVARVTNVEEACIQLETLMDIYLSSALISYTDNPEYRSIMILTTMELWVALDKLAVEEIPMLAEYSPEIPISLLESLLLRDTTNLHRLSRVYRHLSTRHSQARPEFLVLSPEFTERCFPVRYYDRSIDLQDLKVCIEDVTIWRAAEGSELPETEARRLALSLRNNTSRLPLLPKVIAFELRCPIPFRIWRTAVAHLIYRFDRARTKPFRMGTSEPMEALALLSDVHELRGHFVGPAIREHVSYNLFEFCYVLPDGPLRYIFKRVPLRSEFATWFRIRDGPGSQYSTYCNLLQSPAGRDDLCRAEERSLENAGFSRYIRDTIHTSNGVLSAQTHCPPDFPLDGFVSFGHIRSGSSLQWVNILRELRGRAIKFSSRRVHFLLAQATSQVGSLDMNTGKWMWHHDLEDTTFCDALLNELEDLFLDISTASLDEVAMHTISLLLTRVLASSPCEHISDRVLQLLRDLRRKIFGWVQELAYDLMQAPTNGERHQRLYSMAAICRSTFDVGPRSFHRVFHSAADVHALLSCAFFIHATSQVPCLEKCSQPNCSPGHFIFSSVRDYSGLLHQRDRRLSVSMEAVLKGVIQADISDRGIDLAVGDIWPGYRPAPQKWKLEQDPNSHWLVSQTAATAHKHSQTVHINLLNGSLQVDGQPLGRLPHEILEHQLYKKVFKGQALLVIPSDLFGMDYMTLVVISDHFVHFSLQGDDLRIKAQHKDMHDVLELVPPEKFIGTLPTVLIEDHVHWLNLSTSVVEICPLQNIWEQSSENWRILGDHEKYKVCKDHESLVDMHSQTWTMVSTLLKGLDSPDNLVVTTLTNDSLPLPQLTITLPKHGLSFFVNIHGNLESNDFKGMIYDKNQSIGTFFGLENRLVLHAKAEVKERSFSRSILVSNDPFTTGFIPGWKQLGFSHSYPVSYHVYKVDTALGCLTGNSASLESKYFLAYLHAKTSINWKPDPLTGRTGIQEASSILQSAGSQSLMCYMDLSSALMGFLSNISLWCPQVVIPHFRRFKLLHKPESKSSRNQQRFPSGWVRHAGRARYLFPPSDTITSLEDMYVTSLPGPELEDTVYTVALHMVNCHWLEDMSNANDIISNWAQMWGTTMSQDTDHPPSPYNDTLWNPGIPQALLDKVHNSRILQPQNGAIQQLLFLLPTFAYCSSHPETAFLLLFLAFAQKQQHSLVNLSSTHRFLDGYSITEEVLYHHVVSAEYPHDDDSYEDQNNNDSFQDVEEAMECLLKAWPSDTVPIFSLDPHIWDVASFTDALQVLLSSCYRNLKLRDNLTHALRRPPQIFSHIVSYSQQMLGKHSNRNLTSQSISVQRLSSSYHQMSKSPFVLPASAQHNSESPTLWAITLDQLFSRHHAPSLPHLTKLPYQSDCGQFDLPANSRAFDQLLSSLRMGDSPFQERYIIDLHASVGHVRRGHHIASSCGRTGFRTDQLQEHFVQCRDKCSDALVILKKTLCSTANPLEEAQARSGRWPQITTDTLLRCLASTSPIQLSEGWKKCLVSYALLLLEFQRTQRLLRYSSEGLEEEFSKELENEGCDGWNAEERPDWLLIQLQGDFLIRRTQVNIAKEMISPRSGESIIMQVNMGEGKSSVIVPIVAATLADGHQLVRVIVPKPLMVQMLHLLVDRLGGLTNRLTYQHFFSRSQYSVQPKKTSHQEMLRCMEERGILLVQPEDVLSLKLTSVENQLSGHNPTAQPSSWFQKLVRKFDVAALSPHMKESYLTQVLRSIPGSLERSTAEQGTSDVPQGKESEFLELQRWLHSRARDILDESDEILHVRRQLIYTIGHQQYIEGYPDRWILIQEILRLVKHHARSLSQDLPDSVEFESYDHGSFPHFRILRTSDAGRRLILLLVGDVMAGCLQGLRFQLTSETQQEAIRSFISSEDVRPDKAKEVEEYAMRSQQSNLWSSLLLLRGLFASNILLFALMERRWCVDYGLNLDFRLPGQKHTNLAVPYRAKDAPAPNTQFGHPDITILLTCLSYYYAGLNEAQLRLTFQKLLNEDDPAAEYALWVQDCGTSSLPEPLRDLREFNLKSSEQWDDDLFPIFSYNQAAIDFYLSRVVFPQEAKEYPWKLAASSWDLVEKRGHPITGFSGTNDTRYLLPTSIKQHEVDHQQGTAARALMYLLQPENASYKLTYENGRPATAGDFLRMVVDANIRVVLDVGAQILDAWSWEFAQQWLSLTNHDAAVYFDQDGELRVLTRNGANQPLMSSSFAQRLDRCVIYLDDAHTRGTDLKFPDGFRAAVTLGPKVTKDRLVQGCMRMRKLGHGHSVMFFAPLEVDQSIRSVTRKEDRSIKITTTDVLKWAIHETWSDIRQWAPHWAQQGASHKTRYDAWSRFCEDKVTREQLTDAWLQPEQKSLADLYAPSSSIQSTSRSTSQKLETDIERRCEFLGVAMSSMDRTQLDEQLERQVNREIEREREVELPPGAAPAKHFLHPDVVTFVQTGVLRTSGAFRPIFTSLENSSAAATGEARVWSPFILATADFCETVQRVPINGRADQYLRPVQWVLSGRKDNDRVLVILSPYEVDHLLPDIRMSRHVHLHVYVPRTSERMRPTDDLKFYTIPPVPDDWTPPWDLIDQLNLFAGQTYLRDWDAYLRVSHLLGIQKKGPEDKKGRTTLYNLFNLGSWKELKDESPESLLPLVMMLLTIRRRGLPFAETHMGKILQGQLLTEKDFKSSASSQPSHLP